MNSAKTYWNNNGLHQAEYDRLIKLMPMSGKSETVAGELIRAASRLGYDYYNNGMCNNTSGAIEFLYTQGSVSRQLRNKILPEAQREGYTSVNLEVEIEAVMNKVIELILANPSLETTPNTRDMFDYQLDSVCDEEETCYSCGEALNSFGDCYDCDVEC